MLNGDLEGGKTVIMHPPWGGKVVVPEVVAERHMTWDSHYVEFWDWRLDDE